MIRPSHMSIRNKLILIILFVSTISFFIAISVFATYGWFIVRQGIEENSLPLTKVVANNCRGALSFDDPLDAEDELLTLGAKPSIEFACVFNSDGAMFASYYRDDQMNTSEPMYREGDGSVYVDNRLITWQPIVLGPEILGSVMLRSDQSELSGLFQQFLYSAILALLLAVIVAYILSIKLQHTISQPLLDLADTAHGISESKSYSVRAVVHANDEVGTLTEAFNEMLTQVELRDSALTESEDRYRSFVESATEPTFRVDYNPPISIEAALPDQIEMHHERAVIAEANNAFLDLYGCTTPDDAMRGKVEGFLGAEILKSALSTYLATNNIETKIVNARGEEKILLTSVTRTVENNALTRIWTTQRDVTELRVAERLQDTLEKQLQHVQRMDSVGQLAGGIAHDFNNLLVAIMGYIELANGVVEEDGIPEPLPTYHAEIEKAAQRAANLTRQLLAFSRRQMMEMKNVDLNEVLREVDTLIKRLIPENIDIQFKAHDSPVVIHADVGQLDQVIINLAVNARDAMPSGGTLEIRISEIEIDELYTADHPWARQGHFAVIQVIDSGMGMTKDVQEKMFEPFFTTKPLGKGTGLGLSVALGIIEQHKGFIYLYSELEVGTNFNIYLPIAAEAVDAQITPSRSKLVGGTETILVVEDEEQVRVIARNILERAGYTVLEAVDGEEAMKVYFRHEPEIDMLLLDVIMPKMGGKEVKNRIRLVNKKIPILFSSGYSGGEIHDDFVLEEGPDFLPKPYSYRELQQKVRSVLDARSR